MKNSFTNLNVWQKSIDLCEIIYTKTEKFPKSEIYGITNQIRRSAVSIASNIAEGAARNSSKEFSQFLSISLGSIAELKTQLIISKRVNYLGEEDFNKIFNLLEDISRMTLKLKNSIKTTNS